MTTPQIPDYWSPEEALAVFEFIDDLRERIWARYGLRIQEFEPATTSPTRTPPNPTSSPPTIPCHSDPSHPQGLMRRTRPAPDTLYAAESAIFPRVWTAANSDIDLFVKSDADGVRLVRAGQ